MQDTAIETPGPAEDQKQRRPRRPKKEKTETEDQPEQADKPKDAKVYRKKGDGAKEQEDGGKADQTREEGQKENKKRQRKPKAEKTETEEKTGEEVKKYRVKGEKGAEDAEEPVKDKEEKKEKKEPVKNLVYNNPMDFKEKKKFKSKWDEYRFGEWRRGSGKTFVTLETVIPELPAKEMQAPDEATFHKKQVEVEEKIKELIKGMEGKKTQFFEMVDQKKAQRKGNGQFVSGDMKEKFERLSQLNKQKKKIYNEMDSIDANKGDLVKQRDAFSKRIDRKWNSSELVPKGLKELKKTFESSSGGRDVEARYIKEKKKLEDSLTVIVQKEAIDAKLNEIIRKSKEIKKNLPAIIQESKALQAEVDSKKKDNAEVVESLDTIDKQIDKLNEKRKKDQDEIDRLRKQKSEL